MSQMDIIKQKAQSDIQTIVLPETNDIRVLKAASIATQEKLANIILIGNEDEIKTANSEIDLSDIRFIDNTNYENIDDLSNTLYELRKEKGMTQEEAHKLLVENKIYFGTMLVKTQIADGMVAGAATSSADVLRPALQIIKSGKASKIVSAFFLMEVPNCEYGKNGTFVFADCALNPNPSAKEIAEIANISGQTFEMLCSDEAKIALLSFSTKGSAKHDDVSKMESAMEICKETYPNLNVDGTLQLDAAIVPEVGMSKAPNSPIAGKANVLIFPDLDAGNIGYKLVERLAKANAYGPITQGLAKPVNDLSRGCNANDIVGTIAITALQAQLSKK